MNWKILSSTIALGVTLSHTQIITDATAHPVVANETQIKRYVVQLGSSGPNAYDQAAANWNMANNTDYWSWIYSSATPTTFPVVNKIHGLHFTIYGDQGYARHPLRFPPYIGNQQNPVAGGNWYLRYDNDGWLGIVGNRGWDRRSTFKFYASDFDSETSARGYLIIEHY